MNELMKRRVSRRNFSKEKISINHTNKIKSWIDACNGESHLNIEFIEDGREAFNNLSKTYGIFSNIRSLLVMKGNKEDKDLKEKIGYYGEELILKICQLELGTCWVGGTYDNSKFIVPENEMLVCVILVGNIQKSLKDNLIRRVATSGNRKDIKDRIVTNKEIPNWIMEGLEAMRIAPSAMNAQKPTVYYENDIITMRTINDSKYDMVDLGIAKKHFELATKNGKFELGNNGEFILNK